MVTIDGKQLSGEIDISSNSFETDSGVNGPAVITELVGSGLISASTVPAPPDQPEAWAVSGPLIPPNAIFIPDRMTFRRPAPGGRAKGYYVK